MASQYGARDVASTSSKNWEDKSVANAFEMIVNRACQHLHKQLTPPPPPPPPAPTAETTGAKNQEESKDDQAIASPNTEAGAEDTAATTQ